MKTKMKIEKKSMEKTTANKKKLPHIKKEELLNYSDNTWDLFYLLLSKYYEIMNIETDDNFTDPPSTLIAYNILYGEITTGGFLELIKNGYGSYIFESLFPEILKKWGAIEMAAHLNKAKKIYRENKDKLEVARTAEDIIEMYQRHPEFNALDTEFFKIMDYESDKIKIYVQEHISDFAIVA